MRSVQPKRITRKRKEQLEGREKENVIEWMRSSSV